MRGGWLIGAIVESFSPAADVDQRSRGDGPQPDASATSHNADRAKKEKAMHREVHGFRKGVNRRLVALAAEALHAEKRADAEEHVGARLRNGGGAVPRDVVDQPTTIRVVWVSCT